MKILVTGASGALGSALVTKYMRRGDSVIALVRSEQSLGLLPCAPTVSGYAADLSHADALEARLDSLDVCWPEIEGIVHTASPDVGVGAASELTLAAWQENFNVNLLAATSLVRRIVPGMMARRGGVILGVVSVGAHIPLLGLTPYCVSKAALHHYIMCLARELAPFNIRANALGVSFAGGIFVKHRDRKAAAGYYRTRQPSPAPTATVHDNLAPFMFLTSAAGQTITGQSFECGGLPLPT